MGASQRRKGAAGEREACQVLAEAIGGEWRRSTIQSRGGGAEAPDVVSPRYPELHVEVKRARARLDLLGAMRQAVADTVGTDRTPVVLGRQDRGEWLVLVRLEDLSKLAKVVDGPGAPWHLLGRRQ